MLLKGTGTDVSNKVSQPDPVITYLGKLISSVNKAHTHRNGIFNDPVCLIILSAYGGIYLNAKDLGN